MPTFASPAVAPQGIASPHFVYFQLPDGRWTYTLTGVVTMTFQGRDGNWRRERISFDVEIPNLPPGKGKKIEWWAPFVTLNSVANNEVSNQAGWAVDDFFLVDTGPTTVVKIDAGLAVRDSDG